MFRCTWLRIKTLPTPEHSLLAPQSPRGRNGRAARADDGPGGFPPWPPQGKEGTRTCPVAGLSLLPSIWHPALISLSLAQFKKTKQNNSIKLIGIHVHCRSRDLICCRSQHCSQQVVWLSWSSEQVHCNRVLPRSKPAASVGHGGPLPAAVTGAVPAAPGRPSLFVVGLANSEQRETECESFTTMFGIKKKKKKKRNLNYLPVC